MTANLARPLSQGGRAIRKPLDIADELMRIQHELAQSMVHCHAIPMEIGHLEMTMAFYHVECCRSRLHRLQLALGNESIESPPGKPRHHKAA